MMQIDWLDCCGVVVAVVCTWGHTPTYCRPQFYARKVLLLHKWCPERRGFQSDWDFKAVAAAAGEQEPDGVVDVEVELGVIAG